MPSREVTVKSPGPHARELGDVVERRIKATFLEDLAGGVDDRGAVTCGVDAHDRLLTVH
jgi:hypothetical protein